MPAMLYCDPRFGIETGHFDSALRNDAYAKLDNEHPLNGAQTRVKIYLNSCHHFKSIGEDEEEKMCT